jgi:hypothetical protein
MKHLFSLAARPRVDRPTAAGLYLGVRLAVMDNTALRVVAVRSGCAVQVNLGE